MRELSSTAIAYLMLMLAMAACAGAWLIYSDVSSRLSAREQALSQSAAQSAQQENAAEAHALVEDTAAARASLLALSGADVVTIANEIESAGSAAGAQISITSAAASGASSTVNSIDFDVQANGTFAQVWRTAQLLETLPLPSRLDEVDFDVQPQGKGAVWQLAAHVQVLTTSQVSS